MIGRTGHHRELPMRSTGILPVVEHGQDGRATIPAGRARSKET